MHAIDYNRPAVALWLVEHRGQHDLETVNDGDLTAVHWASYSGMVEVMQALLAAGANPAALTRDGITPLMFASYHGHTDIVAFLLQQPAVKASIDIINEEPATALSLASFRGYQPIVQLLLDAGADPSLPAGPASPLRRALDNNHHAIAALLRHAIAEPDRARALHKARCLLGAGAAQLACLQGRVERGKALPQLGFALRDRSRNEKLREATAFAAGVSGGEKDSGLCDELYVELQGYMLHAWADNAAIRLRQSDRVKKQKKKKGEEERRLIWEGVALLVAVIAVLVNVILTSPSLSDTIAGLCLLVFGMLVGVWWGNTRRSEVG